MTRYLICCLVLLGACQAPKGSPAPVAALIQPTPAVLEQGAKSPMAEESEFFGKKKKKTAVVGSACSKTISCGANLFCDLNTSAGAAACTTAITGKCADKPTVCTRDFRPVCGCDGKTYGNDCARKAAGVSLAKVGACEESGKEPPAGSVQEGGACGGKAGLQCAEGLFCEATEADGLTCGTPDRAGVCASKPTMCTFDYRPVCGCDGKTYSNDCARRGAGVSRSSTGACADKPTDPAPPALNPSGQRLPIEGVLMTLEPKSCKSNPWETTKEVLPKSNVTHTEKELETIASFFQLKKIELVELGLLKATTPVITCKACSCARGDTLVVVAKKEDVDTLKKTYGFSVMAAGGYLAATPIACNMNPWSKLEGADENAKVAAYLKSNSVEAQAVGFLDPNFPRAVCAACTCPRGDRLVIKTKDNTKTTAGFSAVP